MATIQSTTRTGKYLRKTGTGTFEEIHLLTDAGQVKTTAAITIGGHPYGAGTSLTTIISALNASGGFQYKLIDTGNLSANGGMIVNLAYSTDGGSTWNEIASDPIVITDAEHATAANSATNADYATSAGSATNATNATNVALTTKSGSGSATITIQAGSGTAATFTVNNVASATKATQDASGNTITTTYATKTELANLESGLTQAYVTNSTAISSGPFMSLIKDKSSAQQTASIGPIAPNTALPLLNNASVKVSELKVGDTVYITEESKCDWFLGLKSQTGSNVWQLVFYSIEADSPSLSGYVTGSGLTTNKIVLGNGSSEVRTSDVAISSDYLTDTDTDILTSAATHNAIYEVLSNQTGSITNGGGLSISGSNPLTSNGDVISIGHATPSGASSGEHGNTSSTTRTYVRSVTTDAYGHVTGVSTKTETVVDTNTWRPINVNGDDVLDDTVTGGALGFTAGAGLVATYDDAISYALATSGIVAGTYSAVTVDAYGRATAGWKSLIVDVASAFPNKNYSELVVGDGILVLLDATV